MTRQKRPKTSGQRSHWTGDIMASLVLFIIALPLSLGVAMASGAPAAAAIVSIFVGGIIVGALSGAPLVVSGPAAGLSAIVLQLVSQFGFTALMVITAIAGLIQITLGVLRLGRFIELIPKTVLEGVLSAIGLIIVIGQLHVLAGHEIPGGPVTAMKMLPQNFYGTLANPRSIAFTALLTGFGTIAIEMTWPQRAPERWKHIPAALPAVLIATIATWNIPIPKVVLHEPANYTSASLMAFQSFIQAWNWDHLILPAAGLAIVASAESLLTARAIDMLAYKHHIPTLLQVNRELIGQGAGNIFSGAFGGIPVSGVMVRSAANVESGARTRRATMLHAVWVVLFVTVFPGFVTKLPSAALAGVLIVTGVHLINFHHMMQAIKTNWREAWPWPVTAMAVIGTDLLKGLIIGIAMTAAGAVAKSLRPGPLAR